MTLKYRPLNIVTYQNILGVFWFSPLFLFIDLQHFLKVRPSLHALTSLLMLALLASALAFVLFVYAVKELGASRSSIFSNCIAVFTAVLAWLLLKETLTPQIIIGIAVVISGLLISQVRKKINPSSCLRGPGIFWITVDRSG